MSLYFILLVLKQVNVGGGSCNNINDPYAKICVPDAINGLNVKVFNLMSSTNETRHIKWHEACKCKCRLDASVCNNKQRWDDDKCRCECKELIEKGVWDKGYPWNPSNCECECDKSCDFGEYLGYENCECRKRLVDKLVEKYNENIDEAKLTEIALFEHKNECACYYTVFIVLAVIALAISIVLILFTINAWIVIKKMFLHMIMFIMQKIINLIKRENKTKRH